MELIQAALPGYGHVHHVRTRGGQRLGIAVDHDGTRLLSVYAEDDPDTPLQTLRLERDEADALARLLHDESLSDRLTALEREAARLATRG